MSSSTMARWSCRPDQYFMMGDNRDNSADSRIWGFLKRDSVKGKALIIYWSYEAEREDYQEAGAGASLKRLASVFVHFFTQDTLGSDASSDQLMIKFIIKMALWPC